MSNRKKLVVVGLSCLVVIIGAAIITSKISKAQTSNACVAFTQYINNGDAKNSYALFSKKGASAQTLAVWSKASLKAKGSYGTNYKTMSSSVINDIHEKPTKTTSVKFVTNQTKGLPNFQIECYIVKEGGKSKVDSFAAKAL